MNPIFAYPLVVLLGYLLGTCNLALLLARLKHVDLSAGSGNPGASNAMILMGWKAGILVGLHDIGKAALAVALARWLFPTLPYAGGLAGAACILGHMFPFYRRFRGGKGFATYIGVIVILNWRYALILGAAIIALVLITDYIVAGTMATVVSFPIYQLATGHYVVGILLVMVSLIIIYKHRQNLVRIFNGTEIGLRSAHRGEHRAKQGQRPIDPQQKE